MHTKTINLKATREQHEAWVRAAEGDGRSLSGWMRVVLDRAAGGVGGAGGARVEVTEGQGVVRAAGRGGPAAAASRVEEPDPFEAPEPSRLERARGVLERAEAKTGVERFVERDE